MPDLATTPVSHVSQARKYLDLGSEEGPFLTVREATAHLQMLEDGMEVKLDPELHATAKHQMIVSACTDYDPETNEYKWRPVWNTKISDLGVYGVGVRLYFAFLLQMGFLFLLCSIITSPMLDYYIHGSMVLDTSSVDTWLASLSIANLGACEAGVCVTNEDFSERCARNKFPCVDQLKFVTEVLGIVDAIAIILFISWSIFFKFYWIPFVSDGGYSQMYGPADFTVNVPILPRRLGVSHKEYEALLKEHFRTLLQSMTTEVVDSSAIVDVSLVRKYDGAISLLMQKEASLMKQRALIVRKRREERKGNPKSIVRAESFHRAAMTHAKQMLKLESRLSNVATKTDAERDVIQAFVSFKCLHHCHLVLRSYRFSNWTLCRLFQNRRLRFHGHRLKVSTACPPIDVNWENLDLAIWNRACRKISVFLAILALLVICSLFLLYFRWISPSDTVEVSTELTWIVKSTAVSNVSCLRICDLQLFGDPTCADDSDTSDTWDLVKAFDANRDYSPAQWQLSNTTCSSYWRAPVCNGPNPCANGTSQDWLGFQFNSSRQVGCMQITLMAASLANVLQLYSCASSPPETINRSCWSIEDNCKPMYPIQFLWPENTSTHIAFQSTLHQVAQDTACSSQIPYSVAKQRYDSFPSNSAERVIDALLKCYCIQQEQIQGTWFGAPPFSTEEQNVCSDFNQNDRWRMARLFGSAAVILIINHIFIQVYPGMVRWERNDSASKDAISQFWKLLLLLLVNTGVLILLVNAYLKDVTPAIFPLSMFSIGTGSYYDFNATWYASIGATLCIVILGQVLMTAVPAIVNSICLHRLCIWCRGRQEVIQERLDGVYELPEWNLPIRLAQSMLIVWVIFTYSSAMPVLYILGFCYCFMVFWLDKWLLLRWSKQPDAYTASIIEACTHFFPVVAIFHVAIACWTLGNQTLFPSGWSALKPLAEGLFGATSRWYQAATQAYLRANYSSQQEIQGDNLKTRLVDFSREGCEVLFLILLALCIYFIILFGWLTILEPFVTTFSPSFRRCNKKPRQPQTWERSVEARQMEGTLCSYQLRNHPKYGSAILALNQKDIKAASLGFMSDARHTEEACVEMLL